MGCGGSKKKDDGIDMEMAEIGVSACDEIFQAAAGPLQILAEHYDAITGGRDDILYYSGVEFFLQNPNLNDGLKAMIYIFSALGGGEPTNVGLKFIAEEPYVDVNTDGWAYCNERMYEAFKDIVKEVAKIPTDVVPIAGDIATLAEKCTDIDGLKQSI